MTVDWGRKHVNWHTIRVCTKQAVLVYSAANSHSSALAAVTTQQRYLYGMVELPISHPSPIYSLPYYCSPLLSPQLQGGSISCGDRHPSTDTYGRLTTLNTFLFVIRYTQWLI